MNETLPQPPADVMIGKDFWAPFGTKRWSAVRVLSITDGIAEVTRVNASSNEPKTRRSKVKTARLVKRDPNQKGKDKPAATPEEMFSAAEQKTTTGRSRVAHLMALLDDDSTIDDW